MMLRFGVVDGLIVSILRSIESKARQMPDQFLSKTSNFLSKIKIRLLTDQQSVDHQTCKR